MRKGSAVRKSRPAGKGGMASFLLCLAVALLFLSSFTAMAQNNNPGNGDAVPNDNVDFGCPTRGASNAGGDCDVKPENPSHPPQPKGGCKGGVNQTAFDYQDHYQTTLDLLRDNWVAALMLMTEQFTVNMMDQMLAVGSFIDAKFQLETQTIYEDLRAQAHNNYHSSFQVCRFGTGVKSLAASDMQGKSNARAFAKAMQDRQSMTGIMASASGFASDYAARVDKFGKVYCSLFEDGAQVGPMCNDQQPPAARVGNDIDFTRMVDQKETIGIDFTDTVDPNGGDQNEQAAEEDILALSRNLFSNMTFSPVPKVVLKRETGMTAYMNLRSTLAMRSVALYSFSSIVGMKSKGSKEVAPYLKAVISELGVPDAEIEELVGKNPSYFAQMEVLTKKMYQNPVFYTNLYDKPENVRRTGVAMQAIKLMQDRDRFESALRREMMISMILELKLREHQENISNDRLFAIIPNITTRPSGSETY